MAEHNGSTPESELAPLKLTEPSIPKMADRAVESLSLMERRRLSKQSNEDLEKSQWERLAMLIGDRKGMIAALVSTSTLAAVCEAGVLAIVARAATALVDTTHQIHGGLGPINLDLTTQQLLWIGFGLAVVRLLLQIPTSYLPARISGDVQLAMRERLLGAYTYSSWELQSKDQEGYFQEMMTNQIAQASQGANQATALIVSSSTFLILVISAFTLNAVAAVAAFVASIGLFVALRPANALAMRLARRLSAAPIG
jgi:ABC-type multidrug transport system fused ATPase/permease subunit